MRSILILSLIILISIFVQYTFAQETPWMFAQGTGSISIADIDIYKNNPDTIYALGSKFLRSTDNGETWHILGLISAAYGAIRVNPINSQILYASHTNILGVANDVSMSTDGGLSWKRLFRGRFSPAPVIEIDPFDPNIIYVGVGPDAIHRTTDGGQNWQEIFSSVDTILNPYYLNALKIDPTNSNILYAAYATGLYKSVDFGNTWFQLPIRFANALAINPKNPSIIYAVMFSTPIGTGGVFKSNNGGKNWFPINNGLDSTNWRIYNITLNPKYPDELYIGCAGEKIVFRSTNGGNLWFVYNSGLSQGNSKSIVIDTLSNKVFVGTHRGIYINSCLTTVLINERKSFANNEKTSEVYPNPFNGYLNFIFSIEKKERVTINIYDILGKEIKRLDLGEKEKGEYRIEIGLNDSPSGTYFLVFMIGNKFKTHKILLLK